MNLSPSRPWADESLSGAGKISISSTWAAFRFTGFEIAPGRVDFGGRLKVEQIELLLTNITGLSTVDFYLAYDSAGKYNIVPLQTGLTPETMADGSKRIVRNVNAFRLNLPSQHTTKSLYLLIKGDAGTADVDVAIGGLY